MTQTPFITAEHSTNPRPGIWVMITTFSIMLDGVAVLEHFEVTTSTGYRAVLPACMSDLCRPERVAPAAPLIRCTRPRGENGQHSGQSVDAWCKHVRTHCHSMHIEQAEVFAEKVAATYGSAGKPETSLTGARLLAHPKRVRNVSVKEWANDPYARALESC
jgi:hypothetical protein